MANWKRVLGAVVIVAAAGVGYWAYDVLNTGRSSVADDKVALADVKAADPAAVKRGEYVMRTGDCMACHTSGQGSMAGGYKFATAFGTLVSSNITPDRATGIGAMTERGFFDAVRHGQGSKGFLYPAMPYTEYAKLSDQDMHDLWAYMSTVPVVSRAVDENAGMRFPYNMRLAMAGWNLLFFENKGFTTTANQSDEWSRGKYLVDAGGHCAACHSPRNDLGAEIASKYLQGGSLGASFAPDLSANPHSGLGGLSAESIAAYLKSGANETTVASGAMAEVVSNSTQYLTNQDAMAIATYLKSVPASQDKPPAPPAAALPQMQAAALKYEVNCSACHGVNGQGIPGMIPAFAGNHTMVADDASNLIRAMLVGGRAVATHDKPTGAGMPSFAWKMDDRQIAETLTYVRNSWGNAAAAVQPADVAKLRQMLAARQPAIN
jgi:mono/diheme cytochrome c family protein